MAGDLSGMIGSIAQGIPRQADAIAQVNTVIAELDTTTQHNAALVEESTASSHSLATEFAGRGAAQGGTVPSCVAAAPGGHRQRRAGAPG